MSLSGLITAVQFMTRLPVPRFLSAGGGDLGAGAPWLPLTGALVGGFVAGAMWLSTGLGPSVAALVAVLAWIAITGALHLEGLGDVTDGLAAAHSWRTDAVQRFLEVARDPHVGAFGAIAMALQIVVKLVLLAEISLGASLGALVLVGMWARWGTLLLAASVPPLGQGLGHAFASGVRPMHLLAWGVVLEAWSFFVHPLLCVAPLLTLIFVFYWRRRLGGITGDCHGASIEMTESLLLFLLVAARG